MSRTVRGRHAQLGAWAESRKAPILAVFLRPHRRAAAIPHDIVPVRMNRGPLDTGPILRYNARPFPPRRKNSRTSRGKERNALTGQ
jgi:hypothetical protein